jgi:hypothetical protein
MSSKVKKYTKKKEHSELNNYNVNINLKDKASNKNNFNKLKKDY